MGSEEKHQQGISQDHKRALNVTHCHLLTNLFIGTPQWTFLEFYDSLFQKWGQANPHDLVANEERMMAPWDPNERDIADVIKQIHDGALFCHYVGQNFDNKWLVTIGKKLILDKGLFAQQYQTENVIHLNTGIVETLNHFGHKN